ncbi:MAG: hypothetical protein RR300_04580 [Raoultibacter sp.]
MQAHTKGRTTTGAAFFVCAFFAPVSEDRSSSALTAAFVLAG